MTGIRKKDEGPAKTEQAPYLSPTSIGRGGWFRAGSFWVGFAGLAIASRHALSDIESSRHAIDNSSFAIAVALSSISALVFAKAWSAYLGLPGKAFAADLHYLSANFAKYVPLGPIVQLARQAQGAVEMGRGIRVGAFLSVCLMMTIAGVAGALVGLGAVIGVDTSYWTLLGFVVVPLASRRAQVGVMRFALARRFVGIDGESELPPPNRHISAVGLVVVGLIAYGCAFSVLAASTVGQGGVAVGHAAVAAWLVGFLAIPIPGGLGLREATLAILLSGTPIATLVGFSVLHRLTILAGELLALVAVWVVVRFVPVAPSLDQRENGAR